MKAQEQISMKSKKNCFNVFKFSCFHERAFTLVETVVYIAVLSIVLIVVVMGVVRLGTGFAKARNIREVNETGSAVMDRMLREVRKGTSLLVNGTELTVNVPLSFAELVRKDGAVSHWDFEEKSGHLVDKIGGINSISEDSTNFDKDENALVGNGYKFNKNESNFIELPAKSLEFITDGAVEAIVKPEDSAGTNNGFQAILALYDKNLGGNLRVFGIGIKDQQTSGDNKFGFGMAGQCLTTPAGQCEGQSTGLLFFKRAGGTPLPGQLFGNPKINTNQLDANKYYHFVWEKKTDPDNSAQAFYNLYMNGTWVDAWVSDDDVSAKNQPMQFWYWLKSFPLWNRGYSIGASGNIFYFFNGIIDEIAIYDKVKNESTWKSHYDSAFQTSAPTNLPVKFTFASNAILINQWNSGSSTVSSSKIKISNVSFTPLVAGTINKGVRIQFTASAGNSGSKTYVEQTFVSSAIMRNPATTP